MVDKEHCTNCGSIWCPHENALSFPSQAPTIYDACPTEKEIRMVDKENWDVVWNCPSCDCGCRMDPSICQNDIPCCVKSKMSPVEYKDFTSLSFTCCCDLRDEPNLPCGG